jgi:hypothetical protein
MEESREGDYRICRQQTLLQPEPFYGCFPFKKFNPNHHCMLDADTSTPICILQWIQHSLLEQKSE